jgi:penicillin amidase
MSNGAAEWCDIAPSTADENCTEIARLALDDALQELVERYGTDLESWRWGAAHEAHHDHQVLGDTALFSWIVNIRQPTSGGDFTLQRAARPATGPSRFPTPMRRAIGASTISPIPTVRSSSPRRASRAIR